MGVRAEVFWRLYGDGGEVFWTVQREKANRLSLSQRHQLIPGELGAGLALWRAPSAYCSVRVHPLLTLKACSCHQAGQ